jgi:hypothetical protein
MMSHSDYIIYVDESGDHNLESIDQNFPVFVLAFCIFNKQEYIDVAVPSLKQHKFNVFGHDAVVLHEREIRKQEGAFSSLLINRAAQDEYCEQLNDLMLKTPMKIIAAVIDKHKLKNKYISPGNPYHLALGFCLERASYFLRGREQQDKLTHVIVERRGKKEDKELELEFYRITTPDEKQYSGLNYNLGGTPFKIHFISKEANMAGIQLADLIARPIGRWRMNPAQPNRAMSIIRGKGFDVKTFP